MAERTSLAGRIGFLAMSFVLVGLAGFFGTYATPIPLVRALRREAALDRLLAAANGGAGTAAEIKLLAPELGASARVLAHGAGDLAARVTAEKARVRTIFFAEARAIGRSARWMIGVVTLLATGFGALLMSLDRRKG